MQYGLSMLIHWCWVEEIVFDQRLAPIAAIVIKLPVTYFLSNMAFAKTQKAVETHE
jgi:hypothetical protein